MRRCCAVIWMCKISRGMVFIPRGFVRGKLQFMDLLKSAQLSRNYCVIATSPPMWGGSSQ